MNLCKLSIRVLAFFLLGGCSGGFEVQPQEPDRILFIKNDNTELSAPSPDKIPDYPIPIIPPAALDNQPAKFVKPVAPKVNSRNLDSIVGTLALGDVTIADVNVDPFTSYAKLTFREGADPYRCTAEFVGPSGDVLMTAAHCVYSSSRGQWNSGFSAYDRYDQGNYTTQYGWQCAAIFSGWVNGAYAYDYAFIKLDRSAPKALGVQSQQLPSTFKSVGYPSNFYSGERLVQVEGKHGGVVRPGVERMSQNPFGKGSSGGAWLDGVYAVGLNSFKFNNDPDSMMGPTFDTDTTRLLEFVQDGCTGSTKSELKLASNETPAPEHGLVEFNADPPLSAIKIAKQKNSSCPCGGESFEIFNSGKPDYLANFLTKRNTNESESSILIHGGERLAMECVIEKENSGLCGLPAQKYLKSASRVVEEKQAAAAIAVKANVTADFCRRKCTDGSLGYCLELGDSTLPILNSLASFVSDTLNKPTADEVAVTIPEMVSAFGGDPAKVGNPCSRSSFRRINTTITNDGVDCRVTSAAIEEGDEPLRLSMHTPTQALATKSINPNMSSNMAAFLNRRQAPQLEFTGLDSSTLNSTYGGSVISIEKLKDRLIVTTENGCVAGEYK